MGGFYMAYLESTSIHFSRNFFFCRAWDDFVRTPPSGTSVLQLLQERGITFRHICSLSDVLLIRMSGIKARCHILISLPGRRCIILRLGNSIFGNEICARNVVGSTTDMQDRSVSTPWMA
jgi:hypothetical protein